MDDLEEPLFSCSREGCREECSWPVDMLRLHNGKPICDDCYGYLPFKEQAPDPDSEEETLMWSDLPPFVPAIIATAREVEGLRAALGTVYGKIDCFRFDSDADVFRLIDEIADTARAALEKRP